MAPRWNQNTIYYKYLLDKVPAQAERGLDVGCGGGSFAYKLTEYCKRVEAVDRVPSLIEENRKAAAIAGSPLEFAVADLMTTDFEPEAYDFVSVIAVLHHVELEPAVERLKKLLAPGGTLAILDLYRIETATDRLIGLAAALYDRTLGEWWRRQAIRGTNPAAADRLHAPGTPLLSPPHTLRELQSIYRELLPGAILRRHLHQRVSVIYRAP